MRFSAFRFQLLKMFFSTANSLIKFINQRISGQIIITDWQTFSLQLKPMDFQSIAV